MTPDSLRALLDAAAKAMPGPVRNSQCGLEECAGKRECALCVAQRTYDPAKALAAAASPDVIAALHRIVLAAVECDLTLSRVIHELAGAASLCWEPKPTGVFDSQLAIGFCEKAIDELRAILRKGGLRDAGLLTTAPQEPQP